MTVSTSTGRPPKHDANVFTAIRDIVREKNKSTEPITANIVSASLQSAGTTVPPRTVRRMLHSMGMRYIRGQARVYLAEKDVTVAFRAKYLAHKIANRDANGNPTTPEVFLDETYCNLNHASAMTWVDQDKIRLTKSGRGNRCDQLLQELILIRQYLTISEQILHCGCRCCKKRPQPIARIDCRWVIRLLAISAQKKPRRRRLSRQLHSTTL